jgi:hypothetical protein
MKHLVASAVVVCALFCALVCAGCGGDPLLVATFTSRVVQLESCRVVGGGDEGCDRDEQFTELRVDLVQVDDTTWWLYGVPGAGGGRRALLGSSDSAGGMLFVDETSQTTATSGCVLRQRSELSLRIDPERTADVGDPCVSLVGREVATTTSSLECDDVGVPPQPVQRIIRRRWEPLGTGAACTAAD